MNKVKYVYLLLLVSILKLMIIKMKVLIISINDTPNRSPAKRSVTGDRNGKGKFIIRKLRRKSFDNLIPDLVP